MATGQGNEVTYTQSGYTFHWCTYVDYEITSTTDTTVDYSITVKVYHIHTDTTKHVSLNKGITAALSVNGTQVQTYTTTTSKELYAGIDNAWTLITYTNTVTKTNTPQTIGISATITLANWGKGTSTYTNDSALTIPALSSMTVTPTSGNATYNGSAHSAQIKVSVAGATVEYGTSTSYGYSLTATNANTNYTMSSVTATNVADSKTVYYRVSKSGYITQTGTTTITISKRTVTPTAPTLVSSTLTYNGSAKTLANAGSCTTGGSMRYYVSTSSTAPAWSTSDTNWKTSIDTKTAAGTYYIYWYCYVSDTANNNDTTSDNINVVKSLGSKAINKASISPTVSMSGWTYGGTATSPSVSGNSGSGGVTYHYKVSTAADSTYTTTKPSNAGTYTVRATIAETTNYLSGTATTNFTIAKATNPLSFTATQSVTKTFSTSSQTATLSAATGAQGTLSYAINSQKNSGGTTVSYFSLSTTTLTIAQSTPAGTYTVVIRATAQGNDNYNSGTKDSTVTVTINKASISPTVTMANWAYGGTASTPSVSGNSGSGTVTYTYKLKSAADSAYSTTKPSDAGVYTIKASIAETTNYLSGTATKDFSITFSTTSTAYSGQYDGSAHSASIKTSVGGAVVSYGTSTSYGYSVTCTNANTNYTMSSVSVTNVADSPKTVYYSATKNGYTVTGSTSVTVSANTSMTLTATAYSARYDGSAHSAQIKSNLASTTINYGTSTSYGNSVTAGTSNVSMSSVTRTDNGITTVYYQGTKTNYSSKTGSTTITITPKFDNQTKSVSYSASAQNIAITAATGGTSFTYSKVSGDFSVSGTNIVVPAGTSPGSYSIVVRATDTTSGHGSVTSDATYSITVNNLTLTLTPTKYSGTYDGSAHSASIKSSVASTTVNYGTSTSYGNSVTVGTSNVSLSSVTRTAAGTTTVYYQGVKTNYTTVTDSTTIEIDRASVGAKPTTSVSKTYNGSSQTNNYTTPTGVTMSGNNSGTAVNTYTATYTPDSNHKWSDGTTSSVTVTLTIGKRTVTPTAPTLTSGTLTYNGSAKTLANVGSCTAGGTMYYYVSTSSTAPTFSTSTWKTSIDTKTDAGTYYVYWYCYVSDTTNNNDTSSDNINVVKSLGSRVIGQAANPITYANQTWSNSFSTSAQTKTLNAATNGQGTVSYSLQSQKQGTTTVNYFTFNTSTRVLTMAANTPSNTYTVVVRASAAGNTNYSSGTADSTITVTVDKAENPMTWFSGLSASKGYASAFSTTANAASNAQGTVTYSLVSQKNSGGTSVSFFSFNTSTRVLSATASNAPVDVYTIVLRASAAGNSNYYSKTLDATATITVSKSSNPLTYANQTWSCTFSTSAQTKTLNAATNGQGTVTYSLQSQKQGSTNVTYFSFNTSTRVLTMAANTPVNTYTVVVRASAEGNDNYESGTADSTITVTVSNATLTITPTAYSGDYNGAAHSASIKSSVASTTISYGTSTSYGNTVTAGTSNVSMSGVTRTNPGTTTVYYKATKANYNDVTGSTTITITGVPVHTNNNGTWKHGVVYVKVGSTWKKATAGYIRVNGVWKAIDK